MPIYEYRCPDCSHEFEVIQSFRDDPIKDCPQCSGAQVKKKISLSAFTLKGSGWYKDHYGLKSGGSSGGAESSSAPESSSSSAEASTTPAASSD